MYHSKGNILYGYDGALTDFKMTKMALNPFCDEILQMSKGHSLEVLCTNIQRKRFIK